MNIEDQIMWNRANPVINYKQYTPEQLLEECAYLFCKIPNKKYKPKKFKDTYELVSAIEKYLKS